MTGRLPTAAADREPMMPPPEALPPCSYPTAADVDQHGVQPLPDDLPVVDMTGAERYRSRRYRTTRTSVLAEAQLVRLAEVVGEAFGRLEPMARHLRPGRPPATLRDAIHHDPLGEAEFGPWTTGRILTWLVRLLGLTDPTSPRDAVSLNEDVLAHSLAVLDETGAVIGGAINEPMPASDHGPAFREGDPFLDAVLNFAAPIFDLVARQDDEAVTALADRYPAFTEALTGGRVGHHFMIARGDGLPRDDAFELVAATVEHFRDAGFRYVVVEASKQWTGAACEALGGVRVHFAPFRTKAVVPTVGDGTTSPDGFVSDKDSGCMFYLLRLG
jgi:hypothetical protein